MSDKITYIRPNVPVIDNPDAAPYVIEEELFEKIDKVIYDYAGLTSIPSIIGVLELCKNRLLKDNG